MSIEARHAKLHGGAQFVRGDVTSPVDSTTANAARAASIRREIAQLVVLVLLAIGAFFVTRALAANNRDETLRDADAWYRRGQRAVAAGKLDEAIDALRHAAVRNRTDKDYVLALAHALALARDYDASRGVLLTLRDSAPEDADVNLQLARLAAERQDVTEAVRFYHNALYAPWPTELGDARRNVRFELIRFLLTHDQSARADAELLAMSAELPDQPQIHLQVARLFEQATDHEHALDQFQDVLRLAPDHRAALAGAGLNAFELGRYALARTYLARAPSDVGDVATTLQLTDLVLSRDPLANRIGSIERRRRLTANLAFTRDRLAQCSDQRGVSAATAASALLDEANAFAEELEGSAILEQDTIEAGVDLILRMEQHVAKECATVTPLDRALVLIGREHGGDTR